jgi:hypothetical protein
MLYKLQVCDMNAELVEVWVMWWYCPTVCVMWQLVLQSQKAAPHRTQSHVGVSWHGELALSRRTSWRSCRRCGPQVVGVRSALGHPTLQKHAPATRLQALIQLMGPWRRTLCETWICMWSRCVILELLQAWLERYIVACTVATYLCLSSIIHYDQSYKKSWENPWVLGWVIRPANS